MTASQSFQKMLSNLNPTEKQRASIQVTRDTIDQTLQNNPRIHLVSTEQPSFFTGSYSRHTIIRPLYDIDLYVRVNYTEHAKEKPPRSILVLMARALRRRYVQTKIDVDSPCVVIKFSDYKFEIVPVVGYQNNDDQYLIPAPGSREWIDSYPHVPNKWLTSSNHYNNQKFIPLIKILKQWNRANKVRLKPFHLELLTGMVFSNVSEITSYPQGVYDWMYSVSDWVSGNDYPFVLEPGKRYTYVDQYLYDNKFRLQVVRKKLGAGLRKAELAYNAWLDGKEVRAKSLWRQMFGNMFPAPIPLATPGRLVPPKPIPRPAVLSLFPPPKPSLLEMALQNDPNKGLNYLLHTPLSKQPKQNVNSLLDSLAGRRKKFPWEE